MSNITEAYRNRHKEQLDEKFDAGKAKQTLICMMKVFAQVKYVGASKDVIKRWDDMWYTTYTAWFSSDEMYAMKLPTKLK